MIILDIETTGLSPNKNAIIEIGAINFENPEISYSKLCRVDEEDIIEQEALNINGQTREQITSIDRISQKELLIDFFEWIRKHGDFYVAGENIGSFDWSFLKIKAEKYDLYFPLPSRVLDLQAVAQLKYFQLNKKLFTENGKSVMSLPKTLEFVGLKDERMKHRALEDCKLEAEAFSKSNFSEKS